MRMIATITFVILATASGANLLRAQPTPPAERVTLAEALERFARDGLVVRIARSEARASAERARQAAAWPNPVAAAAREELSAEGTDHSETLVTLDQPLVWPWRQAARGAEADARILEAEARFRSDSAAGELEVARAWLSAWVTERTLAAIAAAAEAFREADRAATARYEDDDLSGFDLRRLRVERARYESDLAAARIALRAARRRLSTLIAPGGGPEDEIAASEDDLEAPPPTDLQAVLALSRERRPEIAAADAAVEAARARLAGVRGERIPEPTLGIGWKEQSDGFEGAVLGLSIPVPLFDRRGAAVAAASAELDAASARSQLVRRRVEDEVRIAVERHTVLLERAELQRDRLLAGADDLLEIARVSYDAGEISLIELLDAAGAWRDALAMREELASDLVESEYELRRAIGGPIATTEEERP